MASTTMRVRVAQITKRGAKVFVLRWLGDNGRLQQKTLPADTTQRQAFTEARDLEQRMYADEMPRTNPSRMLLSEFGEWIEQAEGFGRRPSTLTEWRTAIKHAVAACRDVRVDQFTAGHVGQLERYLDAEGKSTATVRKTLSTLRAMLNAGVRLQVIHKNPLSGKRLGPPVAKAKHVFSAVQVEAMLGDANPWWDAFVRLAYTSGLRLGEMLNLRRVDVLDDAVRVQGRPESRPEFAWEPKTRSSVRTVPVPPDALAAVLRLHMRTGGSPYVFVGRQRLDHLWRRRDAGTLHAQFQMVSGARLGYEFRALRPDGHAGTIHDIRKSFATRVAASGVPMVELHKFMGHASIATTAAYYTDVEPSAADRLRRAFA